MDLLRLENIMKGPLVKGILIFYLLIGSSYVKELYSGQMKDFLSNNRYAQHFIGFTMMLIIIGSILGVKDPKRLTVFSILGYFWFILTTKLDVHWNMAIIALLILGYLYENNLDEKEEEVKEDDNLTNEDKEKVVSNNLNIRKIIIGSVFAVTIVGTLFYSNKKLGQYGGNFDIEKFLLADRNQ